MIDVVGKYLSEATYVVRFKETNTNIRLRQGDAEAAFGTFISVQSQQTNLPDNFDPNAPRIIFQTRTKNLSISQASCQLNFNFTGNEKQLSEQLEIVHRNVIEFHRRLLTFVPHDSLGETAVIMTVNYPCNLDMLAMHKHLYARFFKQEPHGEIASLLFKIGYKTDKDLFLNFETNVYQLRRVDFSPPIIAPTFVDIDTIPVIEQGIGVKIDVNDKPKLLASKGYVSQGPEEPLSLAIDYVENKIDDLMDFHII